MSARWILLLHMAGSARLAPFAEATLKKLSAASRGAAVDIVVQLDARAGAKPRRYRLAGGKAALVPARTWKFRPRRAMRDFVDWGRAASPRARAALVVWGEGGGWIYPRGLDDSTERAPIDAQLREAIRGSKRGHVDVLGFDACLMGMVEVLYGARSASDCMVASETFTPLIGWPYPSVIAAIDRSPSPRPRAWGERVVRGVAKNSRVSSTLAAWDTGRADALAAAFRALASTLRRLPASRRAEIVRARAAAIHVGNPLFVDLVSLLRALERNVKERAVARAVAGVRRELLRARTANATVGADNRGMGGLSIFFPASPTDLLASYRKLEFPEKTGWGAFLAGYLARAASI